MCKKVSKIQENLIKENIMDIEQHNKKMFIKEKVQENVITVILIKTSIMWLTIQLVEHP